MNSKLNSPYEINKNIQVLKSDLSKFPNEELNNQVNKFNFSQKMTAALNY